jgi:hypothetical protein
MSEWDLIAEYIHNAMQAVDETHKVGKALKDGPNAEKLEALRRQMSELQERLKKLQMVLNNEEAYAVDELVDALNKVYTGHGTQYRRTPRMNENG